MTPSMKAVLAVEVEKRYAALAKKRQSAAGGDRKSAEYQKSVMATLPQPIQQESDVFEKLESLFPEIAVPQTASQRAVSEETKSRTQAAKATGASPRYVQDAKAIARDAPEVFEQVKAGAISIPEVIVKSGVGGSPW